MAKTLAELRASRAVAPPERTVPICLAQSLVAEAQSLQQEKVDLALVRQTSEDGQKRPQRANRPEDVRLTEVDARLEELFEEMREHTGQLRLRAIDTGEWIRWRDAHPPRRDGVDDDGRPILNAVDASVAYSWCNSSALLDDIIAADDPKRQYVVGWNDEPMTPDSWQFIVSNAAPGDLKALVSLVVEMHEGTGSRAPKASLSPSFTPTLNETDSRSHEASESPNAAS